MNKYNLALLVALSSQASYSWALSEQITGAEKYYSSNTSNGFQINSNQSSTSNIVIDNTQNQVASQENKDIKTIPQEYLDLTTDIYPNKKHKNIKALQKMRGLEENGFYDLDMVNFVKQIQSNKGLAPTGIIDRNTWFSIYDQPLDWKLKAVSVAQENWKSIIEKHSNHPNPLMIVVNIPSMTLHVYKRSDSSYFSVMDSKVVIGRVQNKTPLKDFELISLKYNPNWTPTSNMLKKNLYRNGKVNLKWLEEHSLDVVDEKGDIRDYSEIGDIANPRFVQPPGQSNALGNLKFETSSKEDIYLHDTNERHLFNYNTRTYSSGCVRVKDYLKLASIVSEKSSDYIQKNIDTKRMYFEKISNRVPVYFDYSQVFFAPNGEMNFFADVYNKNK